MSEFLGSWKMLSISNFDACLKELGVNVLLRKLAAIIVPTFVLTRDSEGTYTLRTETLFKTMSCEFRFGEPFQELTFDNRTLESRFELDPDNPRVCVQWQTDQQGRTAKITRTIRDPDGTKESGEFMDVTFEVNGVVSRSVFKLLESP